jgi:hypothetical protein
MADSPNSTGGGPESQGINFVYSVQDFGSNVLDKADKSWQSFLNTLKNAGQQTDKFVGTLISKMTQGSAIDKSNGGVAPIITPFTMNQKALDLMPRFVKQSTEWLKNSVSGMAQWAISIGLAGGRTRDFRDALAQAQIEGKKFNDQFAGLGKLLGQTLGKAVGRSMAAAGGVAAAGVTDGILKGADLMQSANAVGIMRDWSDKQTVAYTEHLLKLSNATNLNVNSLMAQATALTANHIPMERQTDDLLSLNATMAKRSQLKPGGAMSDEEVAAATSNMIQIQKLNTQQVAAMWLTIDSVAAHTKLNMPEAVGLVTGMNDTINALTMQMTEADRAAYRSHVAPQMLAIGAAAKEAGVSVDIFTGFLNGMNTMNTSQFQQAASLLQVTGHSFAKIREEVKSGDWISAARELIDATSKGTKMWSPEQLKAWNDAMPGFMTPENMRQLALIGKIPDAIDNTTKSIGALNKDVSERLRQSMNTPIEQWHLMVQKVENFWAEVAIKYMPLITKVLEWVNVLLEKTINFFNNHPAMGQITFWVGALSAGLASLGAVWKGLKMLGWVDVFKVVGGAVWGFVKALFGVAEAQEAVAAASATAKVAVVESAVASAAAAGGMGLGAGLLTAGAGAAIGAGISYGLLKHRKGIDNWMKGHLGFSGDVSHTGTDTPDYTLDGTGKRQQPASDNDDSSDSKPVDTSTMEGILSNMLQVLTDIRGQMTSGTSPLNARVGSWQPQAPSFQ